MQDNDIDGSGKAASAVVTAPQTVADVQHTPAPWTVQPDPRDNGEWEVVQWDATKPTLDEPWYIAACFDNANRGTAEANARLIAAAPMLLEALDALLPSPLCGESWGLPDDETVQIATTFGKLRAARAALRVAATSARQGETR